jgi:TRAP-type C4-dicarboxylate transport system permease small subunit
MLPAKPRWLLQMLIELSAVALFVILFVASVVTVSRNMNSVTPVLEMPFWLFFAPLVLGSLLLAVEAVALLVHTWRGRRPEDKQTVLT